MVIAIAFEKKSPLQKTKKRYGQFMDWQYLFLCHIQTKQRIGSMSEEQRRQLQQQLWKIADDLRGKMNAEAVREATV